jgi:hypothetical protein
MAKQRVQRAAAIGVVEHGNSVRLASSQRGSTTRRHYQPIHLFSLPTRPAGSGHAEFSLPIAALMPAGSMP